jgi:hypothetical protein
MLAVPTRALAWEQDFDNPGAPYALAQHLNPPPAAVTAGGWSGSFIRMCNEGTSRLNTMAFDRAQAGAATSIVLDFDFRMGHQASLPRDSRADGFAVALLNTAVYGTSGAFPFNQGISEEGLCTGSIGVGFDIYQNTGEVSNNHVSVTYDGVILAVVNLWNAPALDLANGQVRSVHLVVTFGPGGALLDLAITPAETGVPVPVFDDYLISGVGSYESRLGFGARTGALYANTDLDNIRDERTDYTSPWTLKQAVVADLTELLPALDRNYDRWLREAISHVRLSLWPGCWADVTHLTLYGRYVFDHERQAIEGRLERMLADPSLDAAMRAVVQNAVDDLIAADEALALTALAEAMAGAGPGKKAQKELALAAQCYARGLAIATAGGPRVRDAIAEFQASWLHSQKALGRKPK